MAVDQKFKITQNDINKTFDQLKTLKKFDQVMKSDEILIKTFDLVKNDNFDQVKFDQVIVCRIAVASDVAAVEVCMPILACLGSGGLICSCCCWNHSCCCNWGCCGIVYWCKMRATAEFQNIQIINRDLNSTELIKTECDHWLKKNIICVCLQCKM